MRIFGQTMVLLMFATFLSCESEQNEQQAINQPNNSGVLLSITEELQPNNYIATTNFSDGKVTDVQYNDGSYDLYEYENNLVKIINKFNSLDILEASITYEYDTSGRLILMTIDSIVGANYTTSEFAYEADGIITTYQSYDSDNSLLAEYQYEYTINNGLIVQFNPVTQFNSMYTQVEYSNENPINIVQFFSDNNANVTNLNFTTNIAADAYTINKYLFGDKWKNNGILSLTPMSLSVVSLREMSANYLNDFITTNVSTNEVIETHNVLYQFDSENRLVEQQRTKVLNQSNQTFINTFTYIYE